MKIFSFDDLLSAAKCYKRSIGRGAAVVVVLYWISRKIHTRLKMQENIRKIQRKREELESRKKTLRHNLTIDGVLMTLNREKILQRNIRELLDDLRSGLLKPLEVLQAYQAKALEVDQDINAVCDFILEATDWAKALEDIPEEERGALYGLPISIKECFYVAGYDSTIGLAQNIGKPLPADCSFVAGLKELHGIPFCQTNIPQTMLSWSCSNPIYGNTANPNDKTRTPGGSSGGEAALIKAGGSLLGIGSDVGGSLRIPAHFSGVCGLKPTNGRLYEDGRRGTQGSGTPVLRVGVYSVGGFMSSTVAGLEVGMKALLEDARRMAAKDWRVVPVNWDEKLYQPGRKLKIAYYEDDGMFPPMPGVKRGLKEVVELLRNEGHELVPWSPMDCQKVHQNLAHFLFADKGYYFNRVMKYEKIDKAIEVTNLIMKTPVFIRNLAAYIINFFSVPTAKFFRSGKETTREIWALNAEKDKLIYTMMREWETRGFDVILSCPFPMPAISPKYCSKLLSAASYTAVYNLVGCPAGILPVTTETAEDQAELQNYPAQDASFRLAKAASIGAQGCPIGVQVIGRHFQEEMVLHVMNLIEALVQGKRRI